MNEILCSFLSRAPIRSTYSAKIHLAANEIIFCIIRGYNGTFQIFVISNLCTYLAIIGSSICAINIWNSFPIVFNLLDNDYNFPRLFSPQNQLSKREKTFLQIILGYNFWMRLYDLHSNCCAVHCAIYFSNVSPDFVFHVLFFLHSIRSQKSWTLWHRDNVCFMIKRWQRCQDECMRSSTILEIPRICQFLSPTVSLLLGRIYKFHSLVLTIFVVAFV